VVVVVIELRQQMTSPSTSYERCSLMEPNGSQQEFSVWVSSLCLWLCHTLPFSIGLHEMLTCASNLRIPSEHVPSLKLLSELRLPVGSQVVNVHWCLLVHVTLVVLSSHSTLECQEKQTPEPHPFLGPGRSGLIHRIWALCSFYSVLPSSITLFLYQ
jgi:hypothetical protein